VAVSILEQAFVILCEGSGRFDWAADRPIAVSARSSHSAPCIRSCH